MNQIPSDILSYWQHSAWQVPYYQLPILKPASTIVSFDKLQQGDVALADHDVWIAPYVFKNDQAQFWIPIWLPARTENNAVMIRRETVLPWMPLQQFDGLQGLSPFTESASEYENALRFECFEDNQLVWQDWAELLNHADELLTELGADWQQILSSMGYQRTEQAWIEVMQPSTLTNAPILKQVATPNHTPTDIVVLSAIFDIQKQDHLAKMISNKINHAIETQSDCPSIIYYGKCPAALTQLKAVYNDYRDQKVQELQIADERLEHKQAQLKRWQQDKRLQPKRGFWPWAKQPKLSEAEQKELGLLLDELQFNPEQLHEKITQAARKVTVERTKIHQTIVDVVESDIPKRVLQITDNVFQLHYQSMTWVPCNPQSSFDLLVIGAGHRVMPNECLALLSQAESVVVLVDPEASQLTPLMTSFEDDLILKQYISDETLIEDMQYQGMLVSDGNMARMVSSALPKEKKNHFELAIQGCEITGNAQQQGHQSQNQEEATFIAAWVAEQAAPENITIVTPFVAQQRLIEAALQARQLSNAVLTLTTLADVKYDTVVFSSVYQNESPRPFVFDQDEKILQALLARVENTLWLIGDLRIFDARMHSPSGELGKRLVEGESAGVV